MALPYYFPWNLSRQFPRTQKKFRLLGFALRTPGMDPAHLTSSLLLVSPSAWPLPLPLSVHPLTLPKHVLYFPTLLCSHWTLLPISFSLPFIMCLASTKCGAFYSVSQSNMSRIFSADIAQVPNSLSPPSLFLFCFSLAMWWSGRGKYLTSPRLTFSGLLGILDFYKYWHL